MLSEDTGGGVFTFTTSETIFYILERELDFECSIMKTSTCYKYSPEGHDKMLRLLVSLLTGETMFPGLEDGFNSLEN